MNKKHLNRLSMAKLINSHLLLGNRLKMIWDQRIFRAIENRNSLKSDQIKLRN